MQGECFCDRGNGISLLSVLSGDHLSVGMHIKECFISISMYGNPNGGNAGNTVTHFI